MITIKNVHTFYGKSHILHGVSFHVPEHSVIALSGRNGVGKTTTLRSIIGFSRPEEAPSILMESILPVLRHIRSPAWA